MPDKAINTLFKSFSAYKRRFIFVFALFLFPVIALAEATVITENTEELNLAAVSEYMEDPAGLFRVERLDKPENDSLFQAVEGDELNKGISHSVVWLTFELRYLSYVGEALGTWLIEVSHTNLDLVTLYIKDEWGDFQELHTGDKYPFDIRVIKSPRLLFPIDIRSGETLRFYLRVETSGSLQVPVRLWSPLAYIERSGQTDLLQGVMMGTIIIMLIYNLIVLLTIRNLSYLFLVGHVAAFLLYQLSVSGLGLRYLWPGYPPLSGAAPFYISLSGVCLILFGMAFLRLSDKTILLSRLYVFLFLMSSFICQPACSCLMPRLPGWCCCRCW